MTIKCVCGYEYGSEYDDVGCEILHGDEEFIFTDNKVTYREDYADRAKTIIICPKCHTLKIYDY